MTRQMHAWESIDLSDHGCIEASAGTGKTYTIERLILRILTTPGENPWRRPIGLDEILVVTYTEKAAAELRSRIRQILERVVRVLGHETHGGTADNDNLIKTAISGGLNNPKRHLESCVNRFDCAAIHTFHGFCHRFVQTHAFDSHADPEVEIGDIGSTARQSVLDLVRCEMQNPENTGDLIQKLRLWNTGIPKLLDLLARIAPAMRPYRGDRFMPRAVMSPEEIGKLLLERAEHFQRTFCVDGDNHPFLLCFDRLKTSLRINASSYKARRNRWALLVSLSDSSSIDSVVRWCEAFPADLAGDLRVKLNDGGELAVTDYADRIGPVNGSFAPQALAAFMEIRNLVSLYIYGSLEQLILATQRRIDEKKSREAVTTYDDMIIDMHKAVHDDTSPLAQMLRRRFRYCIIDEFQDTNRLQWEIFRRLFIDKPVFGSSDHGLLYVVGDPKQSIFSFQGSNVAVYRKALQTIRSIRTRTGPGDIVLNRNYRSSMAMIAATNAVFGHPLWFEENSSGLSGFSDVECGNPFRTCTPPPPGETAWPQAAIILRPVYESDGTRTGQAAQIAHWIISWIRHLTGKDAGLMPMTIPVTDTGVRDLTLSDICILVEKHSESRHITHLLRRYGLPYTKGRNSGLFVSDECLSLLLVLAAIDEPENRRAVKKAMLTPFFGFTPAHLDPATQRYNLIWDSCVRKIKSWSLLGRHRQWPRLFAAIYEQSGILSRVGQEPDGKILIAALRQLRTYCLKKLINDNCSLTRLISRLRSLNRGELHESEEEDVFQKETETDAIRIMTMHSSKGLEFPVVFIAGAGGRERATLPWYCTRNDQDGTDFWIDLNLCKAAYYAEKSQEQRRLYYVALSRAMYRLFIPLWDDPAQIRIPADYENASASERFLSRACLEAHAHVADTTIIDIDRTDHPIAECNPSGPSLSILSPVPLDDQSHQRIEQFQSEGRSIAARTAILRSYSSLARTIPDRIIRTRKGSAEFEAVNAREEHLFEREILPPGALTGDALHAILEKADFSLWAGSSSWEEALSREHNRMLITEELTTCGILRNDEEDEARLQEAARYVFNALHARIPDPADSRGLPLILGEVPRSCRRVETPFHFTFSNSGALFPVDQPPKGWVIGFIDLLFIHNDRWYLLDWKSNWISSGDYSRVKIEENMVQHHYDLQYTIYGLALHRWLMGRLRDYRPQHHFGGILYVYLRGVQAKEAHAGIYTCRPEAGSIERILEQQWPKRLTDNLRLSMH